MSTDVYKLPLHPPTTLASVFSGEARPSGFSCLAAVGARLLLNMQVQVTLR